MKKMGAVVKVVDGQLVLDDPEALGMIRAVAKHNCKLTLEANTERLVHFRKRLLERGDKPEDVLMVILMVDDPHGGALADMLMPGMDWQAFRDRGEVPVARGLAGREGVQAALEAFDIEAAKKLRDMKSYAVVVVDQGVAEVFSLN